MMRVALVARSVFPLHGYGGLERHVYDLARALAQRHIGACERRDQDVFPNRALREEIVRLEDEANLPVPHRGDLLVIQPIQIPPIKRHRAARRSVERADDLEQRTLARTRRADDGEGFAECNFERHLVEHRQGPGVGGRVVAPGDVDQFQ